MARRRLRLTVFSRFLIVMLFLAPAAYIGASYYNGEDGIENIKRLVGLSDAEKDKEVEAKPRKENTEATKDSSNNRNELERLRKENADLKKELRAKEQEIYKLKDEVIQLKRR